MSRNGSGTYSLPVNSWNPANNGTPATAADWQTLINDVAAAITQSLSRDGQTTMTGNLQMGSNKLTGLSVGTAAGDSLAWQQLFSQGQPADLASAATTDIGLQNTTVLNITGTTTITSFGINYNGPRFLRFAGVLTLTHNATTLILPGAANITTAANDCAIVVPSGTPANGWRVVGYMRADGTALVPPATVANATNATNATNVTGGTVSATTGAFSGNVALNGNTTTIGDAGTDTALLNAQLSAGGGVGTSGQVLSSRGANLSPQWVGGLTPTTGAAPYYGARAFVAFDGTRDSGGALSTANTNRLILSSANVTSVLRNQQGDYTITHTVAMPDENHGTHVTANGGTTPGSTTTNTAGSSRPISVNQTRVFTYQSSATSTLTDFDRIIATTFR